MHFIRINLKFVTLLDVSEVVCFHSKLVIASFEDFLGHYMSIGMDAKRSFMNLFDEFVYFVYIHASDQDHVIVSLVEHVTI